MPRIARAHHFIPQFLLAHFTTAGTRDGLLHVTDKETNRQWMSTPENTGHRRDFYRIDGDGVTPELAEEVLGLIEGKAAPLVRHVIETHSLPESAEQMEVLLYFIALLATRIPAARERIDDALNQISQQALRISTATPQRWESIVGSRRESGFTGEEISFDEARRLGDEGGFRFSMSRNWQVAQMFQTADVIMPTLISRSWCMLISNSGNFICSDHPVTIVFTEPPPPMMSPGFALNHTEVSVPLSKHVLLRGVWDRQVNRPVTLNRNLVSHYNTIRILQADRFLFSTAQEFPWMSDQRRVHLGIGALPGFLNSHAAQADVMP